MCKKSVKKPQSIVGQTDCQCLLKTVSLVGYCSLKQFKLPKAKFVCRHNPPGKMKVCEVNRVEALCCLELKPPPFFKSKYLLLRQKNCYRGKRNFCTSCILLNMLAPFLEHEGWASLTAFDEEPSPLDPSLTLHLAKLIRKPKHSSLMLMEKANGIASTGRCQTPISFSF